MEKELYDKVVEYATYDERLGKSHWNVPGHDGDFGFGGHCLPKDTKALLYYSKLEGAPLDLLDEVVKSNSGIRN